MAQNEGREYSQIIIDRKLISIYSFQSKIGMHLLNGELTQLLTLVRPYLDTIWITLNATRSFSTISLRFHVMFRLTISFWVGVIVTRVGRLIIRSLKLCKTGLGKRETVVIYSTKANSTSCKVVKYCDSGTCISR